MPSLLRRLARPLLASSFLLSAITLPMLGGCVVVLSGCNWDDAKFKRSQSLSIPHVTNAGLDVQTENGKIIVRRGGDAEVAVVATFRAKTQERADAAAVSSARSSVSGSAGDNALVLRPTWPDKRLNNEGCSFEITIPDAAWLRLVSSNAPIQVDHLAGVAELKTSNASITITDHQGDLKAKTSNAPITAERIAGSVTADTSNAPIRLSDISGFVGATTSNASADITLAAASPGPVQIKTSNGPISLSVGSSFAGALAANTSNARIKHELSSSVKHSGSKTAATLTFPTSGEPSKLSTSNAGITIRQR